jgi:carboxypeptidase T
MRNVFMTVCLFVGLLPTTSVQVFAQGDQPILELINESLRLEEVAISRAKYDDVVALLNNLEKQYPENAQVFDLGISDNGQMIKGLKVGNGLLQNLLVATHHGNEYGSTEVAKAFAADMAANPIVGQTVFIIPVLNIEGYNRRQRREPASGTTFDPNRNYPGPCGTEGPFTLKSVKALADFIEQSQIVTSATLHTYYPGVFYPWGISTKSYLTPYTDVFLDLGSAATILTQYPVENATAGIYPADGTFEDYAFWKHGIWSLLFEMGHSHSPNPQQIKTMIDQNLPGLRKMYERSPIARAPNHEFTGKCDYMLSRMLDRHDE